MMRTRFILPFLLVLFSGLLHAQTLNLNQFGIEEGLPQSGIHTMVQDDNGNIWFGTMAGVARYNGLTFDTYTKKHGLAENRVISSMMDKNGNIWFGHWTGGISKYNPNTDKFVEVLPGGYEIFRGIKAIYEDQSGNVWFGTEGQGLVKYIPTQEELQGEPTDSTQGTFEKFELENGLSSDIVTSIVEDLNGVLWIGTKRGITRLKPNGDVSYLMAVNGLPSNKVTALAIDVRENIWVGTEDKGVFRTSTREEGQVKIYNASNGLMNPNITVLFQDSYRNMFVGTYGGGVYKHLSALEENNYEGPVFQTISTSQGLSNDKVLCIIQDREKNIWIGTYLNANQYFDEQFEIYGEAEGLINSLVWAIIQDRKGNFWIGTEGGLKKFSQEPNSNESRFEDYTSSQDGRVTNTTALYEDVNGHIWFTNFGNGVSKLDPETREIINFSVEGGHLLSDEVYVVNGDRNGNVWIGTNKGGASKYDIATREFTHFSVEDGLGSDQVYTIYRDSQDRLWFGVLGGKLSMYDGSTFKLFGKEQGYDNKYTLCVTEDKDNNLWFGTYEGGIYKYDGANFRNYTSEEGASTDSPFLLVADNKNNLWIGTNQGIDKFNLKEETFKHYTKQDGFLGIEINPNAVCKDQDDNIWFGSIIGLVKYNSKREKNNIVEPITFLKPPRIYFEEVEIPEDHVFDYNQNHFTFDFVGASLTNPKRVKYKYMLEGIDKDFSPAVSDNYVTYPNLPPGPYTFKVKAANNDGVWNTESQSFQFTIRPPFWQTPWFYGGVTAVVLLLIFTFIKVRERNLKKQNALLEQKVKERTEEVVQQKEEIERKNAHIHDSLDYAKRIQEAIFVSLDHIKKHLPQSFILFKPKDIVSGDFYWMHTTKDKILFAAADCTGHGVPGAFMSIIGINLINRIVKDDKIVEPASILDKLNALLPETLAHSGGDPEMKNRIKDGIDIAFCSYDKASGKLEYAGAYNPLYLVRNGELQEFKADKQPIGKSILHSDRQKFTNQVIDIQEGDAVYLFSDGYADQIGGPNHRKFFYQPFRKLIVDIQNLPMEKQREKLDHTITDWRAHRDQIDDITVLGVKF